MEALNETRAQKFTESENEITLRSFVGEGTRGKQLSVIVNDDNLQVLKDGEVHLQGPLFAEVVVPEPGDLDTWSVAEGYLTIRLRKKQPGQWESVWAEPDSDDVAIKKLVDRAIKSVEKSNTEAVEATQDATELFEQAAMHEENGDIDTAIEFYKKAAEKKSWESIYRLAALEMDRTKRFNMVKEAADISNNPQLCLEVAVDLAQGLSAPANIPGSVEYFRRSAEGGDLRAMLNLATLLLNGAEGVEPQKKEAVVWMNKIAELEPAALAIFPDLDQLTRDIDMEESFMSRPQVSSTPRVTIIEDEQPATEQKAPAVPEQTSGSTSQSLTEEERQQFLASLQDEFDLPMEKGMSLMNGEASNEADLESEGDDEDEEKTSDEKTKEQGPKTLNPFVLLGATKTLQVGCWILTGLIAYSIWRRNTPRS